METETESGKLIIFGEGKGSIDASSLTTNPFFKPVGNRWNSFSGREQRILFIDL
jgi:hypothetical protein